MEHIKNKPVNTKKFNKFKTLLNYYLIGIGEFSHGIEESWDFRFRFLKYALNKTSKKIVIFNEMSVWMAKNIMNNTIYDRISKKIIKHQDIKIENEHNGGENPAWGKLWQYVAHTSESITFLNIIKYIRKHKDRITLIGVDNDKIDRDYDMYKIIKKYLNKNNINFFWAHNCHVDNIIYTSDNLNYIDNKKHIWFCGHYLKKYLGEKYCIILSQAHKGTNRFNSYCEGKHCEKRTWYLTYFYKKFKYNKNKQYVKNTIKEQLLEKYDCSLISFSNSYYVKNKNGYQYMYESDTWDYILFWNNVHFLKPLHKY